ncbi:MAG: peptidoglycan DD-metalloendopeptidase family protein [Myxococcales bacterium]|jgi:murein DD-endopeptidase MepM/ murein hydrolase activator NlpD|nr:peptidoglycan DD-metalloendopeptidase family protein [Myxococcales bacterium]
MRTAILVCLLALFSLNAWSAEHLYNLPLNDCDLGTYKKCYITAYYDLNKGSGVLKDWNCGKKTYSGHKGTDIGVAGTINVRPVVAAADGKVAYVNDGCYDANTSTGSTCGGGYGNYVKLTHADTGHSTYYAHMAKGSVVVSVGQTVKCGTLLGKAASSGNSTGPHLHFEVRYNSDSVRDDPFTGSCGGPLTYWKLQNGYQQLPSADQCAPTPVNDAAFVSETIPDDTSFTPGQTFTKTWTLKNTGNTYWTKAAAYRFISTGGTQLSSITSVDLVSNETIAPGATKTWSVSMTAPSTPGSYTHNWRMSQNGSGFGGAVSVRIKVVAPPDRNDAKLINETIPAGTQMTGGAAFTKTWTVTNAGNTTWSAASGYRLVHISGSPLSANSPVSMAAGESIAPGATKTWSVGMTAPISAQTHQGTWQMEKSGTGVFGDVLSVKISVPDPTPNPGEDAGFDAGPQPDPDPDDAGIFEPDPPDDSNPSGDGDTQGNVDPSTDVFIGISSAGCQNSASPASPLPALGLLLALDLVRRRKSKSAHRH